MSLSYKWIPFVKYIVGDMGFIGICDGDCISAFPETWVFSPTHVHCPHILQSERFFPITDFFTHVSVK